MRSFRLPGMLDDPIRALVRKKIADLGLPFSAVSEQLGMSHSYMQQFLGRGVPRVLPEEIREKLAIILGIDPSQLKLSVNQVGVKLKSDVSPIKTVAPLAPADMPKDVPVLGSAVGGITADFRLNGQTIDYARRPPAIMT